MMNIIQQVTDPMPTKFSILFLLSYYCCCCYYNYYKITITVVTITLVVTTIATAIKLPYYFATKQFAADIKFFRCG